MRGAAVPKQEGTACLVFDPILFEALRYDFYMDHYKFHALRRDY